MNSTHGVITPSRAASLSPATERLVAARSSSDITVAKVALVALIALAAIVSLPVAFGAMAFIAAPELVIGAVVIGGLAVGVFGGFHSYHGYPSVGWWGYNHNVVQVPWYRRGWVDSPTYRVPVGTGWRDYHRPVQRPVFYDRVPAGRGYVQPMGRGYPAAQQPLPVYPMRAPQQERPPQRVPVGRR